MELNEQKVKTGKQVSKANGKIHCSHDQVYINNAESYLLVPCKKKQLLKDGRAENNETEAVMTGQKKIQMTLRQLHITKRQLKLLQRIRTHSDPV